MPQMLRLDGHAVSRHECSPQSTQRYTTPNEADLAAAVESLTE